MSFFSLVVVACCCFHMKPQPPRLLRDPFLGPTGRSPSFCHRSKATSLGEWSGPKCLAKHVARKLDLFFWWFEENRFLFAKPQIFGAKTILFVFHMCWTKTWMIGTPEHRVIACHKATGYTWSQTETLADILQATQLGGRRVAEATLVCRLWRETTPGGDLPRVNGCWEFSEQVRRFLKLRICKPMCFCFVMPRLIWIRYFCLFWTVKNQWRHRPREKIAFVMNAGGTWLDLPI